jgi:iron complex transport system permease protein
MMSSPSRAVRFWLPLLTFLLLLILSAAVLLGQAGADAILGLLGGDTYAFIAFDLHLPRALAAALAGFAFALAGVILQTVTGNSLAEPGLIGVNHGAALAVVAGALLWPELPVALQPVLAFAGGMVATAILVRLARGSTSPRLVWLLVGLALAAFAAAAVSLAVAMLEAHRLAAVLAWLAGSVYGASWSEVLAFAPWIILLALAAQGLAARLDALALGRETARALGCRVDRAEPLLLMAAAALAGSGVALAGAVAFIGLVAPHAARALVGHRHHRVLVIAGLAGAVLALGTDTALRLLLAPTEVPFGVAVAVLGLPLFLFLMTRHTEG